MVNTTDSIFADALLIHFNMLKTYVDYYMFIMNNKSRPYPKLITEKAYKAIKSNLSKATILSYM